ncbi:hypothetical protein ABMA27_007602 [Loxostege sticticalis]|uniref:Odorant receptor n=1 Tax=Loxostege sticticalis TaxID=481309 RepID=A0ABR3HG08_LOXSC
MATFNSEDLFLNRAKFVMKFLGVWIPPVDESLPRKFLKLFMLMLQYLFLIFQTIHIVQIWGDLAAVSQPSYLLFTQACLCMKITVFHVNVDKLRELLKQMASDTFMPQSIVHEKILKAQAARIKKYLLAFMIGSQGVCSMWYLHPLFEGTGVRKFPFDMWMPVSPEDSPQYEIGYAFQLLTICMSAYMYFGVDSVALSLVIFACAQIEIIKDKLLSIAPVQYGLKEKERKIMNEKNHKILVECIVQHQAVVTFTQLVEDTYHLYLLFQLTGDVGVTCMCALRILVEEVRSVPFASIFLYVIVMLIQLFICCWSGHELTANSEDLHTVLHKCSWYEQDLKFKRDLRFAMMRMNRPLVLRAGHYISMSRQTFVAVLRMSYSYFAVLNQANKKDQ